MVSVALIISNKSKAIKNRNKTKKTKNGKKSFLFFSDRKFERNKEVNKMKIKITKSLFGGTKKTKNKSIIKKKNKKIILFLLFTVADFI